eukprot:4620382-Pyramimonas_sp.AAC.1
MRPPPFYYEIWCTFDDRRVTMRHVYIALLGGGRRLGRAMPLLGTTIVPMCGRSDRRGDLQNRPGGLVRGRTSRDRSGP